MAISNIETEKRLQYINPFSKTIDVSDFEDVNDEETGEYDYSIANIEHNLNIDYMPSVVIVDFSTGETYNVSVMKKDNNTISIITDEPTKCIVTFK